LGGGQVQALGHGCAAFSPISSHRPLGRILIRKQIRGCIFNSWLVLIAVLGTVIVVADGLTRTPVLDRGAYWNGPLEYQPYLGAVLLAGLTLALMFGYVRRAGISVTEGLFLWFVFCTTAYTRDFSYIHWPGTPLFVTEIVLVLLFLSIYVLAQSRDVHVPLPVNAFLAMLVAAGALSALRGFLQHSDPIFVLRDAALVAYPLFLHVAHHLSRSWLSIKRMAVWFLLGTGLSVLNGFAWFLAAPQERRFIYYGTYILMALVGTFVAIANRLLPPRTGWLLAGLFCLGLALANARTLFVVLPVLLVVGLCAGGIAGRKPFLRPRIALTTFVAAAVLISAVAMLFLRTETGRDFAERSSQELATGVLHSDEDTNWQFRLSAWKEAWGRFEEYPLAGEGYGIPFAFEMLLFDNDPRPHNTFLTVLYKMGLIGFLPLLALLAYFFWRIIGAAYRNRENPRVAWLWIVVLAVVAFCFYGTANLLLESPFLASLFWVHMGLGLRMARMVDLERTLLRPSHEH
jgi:O-antigen ligase